MKKLNALNANEFAFKAISTLDDAFEFFGQRYTDVLGIPFDRTKVLSGEDVSYITSRLKKEWRADGKAFLDFSLNGLKFWVNVLLNGTIRIEVSLTVDNLPDGKDCDGVYCWTYLADHVPPSGEWKVEVNKY